MAVGMTTEQVLGSRLSALSIGGGITVQLDNGDTRELYRLERVSEHVGMIRLLEETPLNDV